MSCTRSPAAPGSRKASKRFAQSLEPISSSTPDKVRRSGKIGERLRRNAGEELGVGKEEAEKEVRAEFSKKKAKETNFEPEGAEEERSRKRRSEARTGGSTAETCRGGRG